MLCLASALPFIGFGFLDNFLMIVCGEYIDTTICVWFSFSTMAAAAIGNTISDCAGIFSGGAVESLAARFGVEEPPMEREQRHMRVTKTYQYVGQVVGIVIGCSLGCCPLLWLDPDAAARLKKDRERDLIFQKVVEKVAQMLNAEAAELLFVDHEKGDLHARHVTSNLTPHRRKFTEGFIGHSVSTGQFVNVADIQDEPQYTPSLHDNFLGTGMAVQSMICMPVFLGGKVAGAIVAINKRDDDMAIFTSRDEDVLSAISTHVAVAMGDDRENFEHVLESCERSMSKQGAFQWNTATIVRRKTLIIPMLSGMASFLDAESIAVMLLDEEHGQLYTEGTTEGSIPKYTAKVGKGFAGQAVEKGVHLCWTEEEEGNFRPEVYQNYQGSGVHVRSALCVPIFDTRRKCLGAFECINKRTGRFDAEDLQYVQQVASLIAQMLEGPTAELRRVLKMTRQRQQHKVALEGSASGDKTVVCFLERAQDLPASQDGSDIDAYVTFQIVRGNPLMEQEDEPDRLSANKITRQRETAMRKASWHFGKSEVLFQQQHPKWNETLAIPLAETLADAPKHELYLHILLWDYDPLKEDMLVAHTSVPLSRMPRSVAKGARPYRLYPVWGGSYDLDKARVWLSCYCRDEGEPETAQPLPPQNQQSKLP